MRFTILGSEGFIGKALAARLRFDGNEVLAPGRDATDIYEKSLGNVVFCAGVTYDFRTRIFDTVDAHVTLLSRIVALSRMESLLYLSSTRIYRHADHGGEEARIHLCPTDPEDLYDLTKLTGEAICYSSGRPNVRVARLSNVIGPDFDSSNLLSELVRSACETGHMELRTAMDSVKDYIAIDDVVELLIKIAVYGNHRCYNVASGTNVSHSTLTRQIMAMTGAQLTVCAGAPTVGSHRIDTQRICTEFAARPRDPLEYVKDLISHYKEVGNAQN